MTRRLAMRASVWTMLGNSGQQILAFLVFVFLARVLTPAEFGLMALAAALIDLFTVFVRFGQVEALLQRGRSEDTRCSTSFWLIVVIGTLVLGAVLAVAQPFASIFGEPQVALLLFLLAPVPLIHNLGQVHEAFLREAFDYRGLAARNAGATLISGVASVLAALGGLGIYALVIQKLTFAVAYATLVWFSWNWRPRLVFRRADAIELLRVGFDVTVANLINMLNPRIVDIAVGYFLGVVTLGYLRIAWRLLDLAQQLIIQPVSSVAITSLTRLADDREALSRGFLRYLGTLSLIAVPALAGIGILADNAIRFVAGTQWGPSAPMLGVLATVAAVLPVNFLFAPAMLAAGRTQTVRRLALLQIVATSVGTAVAAQFGIYAVLAVHVGRVYLFAALNIRALSGALGLHLRAIAGAIAPPFVSTAAMTAAVLWLRRDVLPDLHPVIEIVVLGFSGAAIYLVALAAGGLAGLWPRYLQETVNLVRDAMRPATERLAEK